MHGRFLRSGLQVQNALGGAKFFILLAIVIAALLNLVDAPYFRLREGVSVPRNFESDTMWDGSFKTGISGFVTGMFSIIWLVPWICIVSVAALPFDRSFNGYQNANYALAEVQDPVRTIKRAAPLAMAIVSIFYFLINAAYYLVIAKEDILGSRRIVAYVTNLLMYSDYIIYGGSGSALFFRNLFGPSAERASIYLWSKTSQNEQWVT
jgi:amino acid transporter